MDIVPEKIINKSLYKKIRNKIIKENPKNSAYRSLLIIKEYKNQGGKLKEEQEKKSNLRNWVEEDWRNLTPYAEGLINNINDSPICGKKHKNQKGPSICRPFKKINKNTPKLGTEYTKKEIKKAYNIKKEGKRINWSNL